MIKVGFLHPAWAGSGGTETWHNSLIPNLPSNDIQVVGIGIYEPTIRLDENLFKCPVYYKPSGCQTLVKHCNVLIIWGMGRHRLTQCLKARRTRPKIISVSHSDYRSKWTIRMMKEQMPYSSHMVYVSDSGLGTIPLEFRNNATKICNGVDPGRIYTTMTREEACRHLQIDPKYKYITYLGRIHADKQIHKLANAVLKLPEEYRALIVGRVPKTEGKYLLTLQNQKTIIKEEHTPNIVLKASHATINPSRFEGFGLSTAESMLAEVPTYSSHVGFLETLPPTQEICGTFGNLATIDEIVNVLTNIKPNTKAAAEYIKENYPIDKFIKSWQELVIQIGIS